MTERAAIVPDRLWRPAPPIEEGCRVRDAPRVLLGKLEPMVRLGITAVLGDEGIEVVGSEERPQALLLMTSRLRPDAVVLDLDEAESRSLGDRVRAASPRTTVVFWTRDEELMEVVGPGRGGARRVLAPVPEELCAELAASRAHRVEG